MRTTLVAAAISGSLVVGLFAGAVIGAPVTATAQESTDDATTTEAPLSVRDVLDDLVADGTLTADQADAVAEALADARPLMGHGPHHGPRGAHVLGQIAETLGLDPLELRDALADGATIAELADEAGVSTDDIVSAVVQAAQDRLDDAVANGRIDAADAEAKLAEIEANVAALIAGEIELPDRLEGREFRGHDHGFRGGLSEEATLDA